MINIIVHLDMNSFFASVEQQDNLEMRGKPVGVCEHLGGIIIAASVEAKKWGIKTGTPVWEARKLYPKIILTHTHADRYRLYNRRLVKLVSDYTSDVEVYSIDEVFLDLTRVCNIRGQANKLISSSANKPSNGPAYQLISLSAYRLVDPWEEAVRIVKEIKQRMKTEVGDWLRCSVGIAENKTLAKIGSDLQKPDGLVVVQEGHKGHPCAAQGCPLWVSKDDLYHRLKLIDIPGIGYRQNKNLNALGIKTLLDLKNTPESHLVARFGRISGHHLYNLGQLNSTWKANVHQEKEIKSIGHMYTLPKEFREEKYFVPVLYKLCEMVGKRLRKQKLEGDVLHFYVHDKDYKGFGESKKLGEYIFDGRDIFTHAASIFERIRPKGWQFKLIGVTVANLRPISGQLSIFGHREENRRLVKALDAINEKYGDFTVCRVPILAAGKVFRDSVGFGRVKEL